MMKQEKTNLRLPSEGFVRLNQILNFIPISKASWWKWVTSGKAPPGIKIGRNTTVWRAEDIKNLLQKLSVGESK